MKFFYTRRRIFQRFIPLAECFFLFTLTVHAISPGTVQSKATSVLIEEVQTLLEANSFKDATGHLQEILVRLEASADAESAAARMSCLYQLGECQLRSEDYAAAAVTFKKFIADYPGDVQIPMARFMVLEACARQNDPAQMKAWLDELKTSGAFDELMKFLSDAKNADFRRNAILTLMTGFAEKGELENLRTFLPFCDEAIIADSGLNMALMGGGDRAFDEGHYARALILYRMVRQKDEVIPVYSKQVAALEAVVKEPLPWVPLKEQESQKAARQDELDRLDGLKQTIQFFNDTGYDQDLMVRKAQCYDAMQRYRLAFVAYSDIFNRFPDHHLVEQCRASAFQSLLALDDQEAALAAGRDYLERYPLGRFEDEVTLSLMQLYLARNELPAAVELGRRSLAAVPNRRMADQISYVLGIALLQQQNWPEAFALFTQVQTKWPQSGYVQDAAYWGSMCYLFEGRFAEAVKAFKSFLKNPAYVPGRLAADVTYRLGVAQYGAETFAEAEVTFKDFLARYPDSPLVSEACSMIGDLRAADGELDKALSFYQKGIASATDTDQDSYAVFQSALTYELQQKYADIVEVVKAYIARRGAQSQLAEAGNWVGKACKARDDRRPALEFYLKTLSDFGNDPAIAGIDQLMIQTYQLLKDKQGSEDHLFAVTQLSKNRETARQKKERALVLRLAALQSRLAATSDRAGCIADILAEKDLAVFSPWPLIILAEQQVASGEVGSVDGIAKEFKTRFPDSELLVDLLNVQASACLAVKQYDKAIALTEEALSWADSNPRTIYSRKLQADAFRLSGNFPKAIDGYQKVFSSRAERGVLVPETLYWIGVCKREQGDIEKAFAFFQRVYVLYKSHSEWAAKAYEASTDCLQKLGRPAEVIQTRKEMVADPAIQNTPEGRRAAEALRSAGQE